NNSVLFLTTLGVYLGLMLVGGAAPQVFAHGALTRQFELQDEIEFADDLEKKPDDDVTALGRSIERYFDDVEGFLKDLRKLKQIDKFDPDYSTFSTTQVHFSPCPETGGLIVEEPVEDIDRWLRPAIIEAQYAVESWSGLGDCLPSDKFMQAQRSEAASAGFVLKFDKSELRYEISIKKSSAERADLLLANLQQAFKLNELKAEGEVEKVLWKNTRLRTTDNQVFIVTRLPRAALDPLLATRAK
ncbi:MAG TPA: hypothetical protein VFZ49_00840, partial [Pyrinomonadaceae bacterium]